ncbi:MAG TPA: ABC transporter permease [Bryobacteraceae bacterium]|nr:ABC transporter permease [Bryobacteraceae bacterium]
MRSGFSERLWQDIRYALRMMRRSPGFTTVAVLSLALGIGANTAVFSLINALMLHLLPVREPEQLVELLQHYPGEPRGNGFWSWPSYEYYRDHNHVFSGLIGATAPSHFSVRGKGVEPEMVNGESVTSNFFSVLGVKPAIGRLIGPEDSRVGSADSALAVVSWSYWKNRFNLDPAILGKPITIEGLPVTVIGVTPPEFFGLLVGSKTDIWLPLLPSAHTRLGLIARLKPGVSIKQAFPEMSVLYRFTIEERASTSKDPLVRQLRIEIEPAGAGLSSLRDHFAKPLFVLMALVGLVLLIACTNIAGLLLARVAARYREMAVRVSLGASRLRLAYQVLTECLLLSAVGSLFGAFLAYFGAGALVRIMTSGRPIIGLPQPLEIPLRPDAHVLLFTTGIASLSAVLFGLAPAWNAFVSAPAGSLREMGSSGETKFRRLFGRSLVVAQVALSAVLLSAAGLFVRHLSNLQHLDLGFRRDHVLLVTLNPSHSGYNAERLSRGYEELLTRLEGIPGVRSASLSAPTPLSGAGASGFATVEGYQERPQDRRYISLCKVAPKYFETLGIPLLAGRDFNLRDQNAPSVAIVNQAMARYYFARGNPIGRHVTLDHATGETELRSYEIVGVVGDAKYYEIREPAPRTVYLPAFQNERVIAQTFVLRTNIEPERVAGDVRRTVRDVLKTIPVAHTATLSNQIDASIVPERLIATLSGLFGALGSVLVAIGIYGLLAYTVARRINEIGIRMALGATPRGVTKMVLGDALGMVCVGLSFGIPIALWGKRFAASFVPDLPVTGAFPMAFGAVTMIVVALLAAYMPARRAARVDPMEALRHE